MSAGWVAGGVRARAMARRQVGAEAARVLAASDSLETALRALAAGRSDRGARPGQTLAAAQHAVAAALLWDLRVLAGWLPGGGGQLMRALAGWFELANADELVRQLSGGTTGELFELGALATAWPRLRESRSLADLRAVLAASAWHDPGGDSEYALRTGMRIRWAERVADLGGRARDWAAAGLVLLLASERFAAGRTAQPVLRTVAADLLGPRAVDAATLSELAGCLPGRLSWVLDGLAGPADLWRGEVAVWAQIERDGLGLLSTSAFDFSPVLGAAAVLAVDARRINAALVVASRGGGPLEAYDAVA
ncbi:MAG: hypothetical protein ACLQFR_12995 [Streptosporangiaceae bacterium]